MPLMRHPGDVVRVGIGASVLAGASAIAATHRLSRFEADIFDLVNRLPDSLHAPLWTVMQVGTLGAVPITAVLALGARRWHLARDIAITGTGAYLGAKLLKSVVGRQRPAAILESVFRSAGDAGLGFPSGHAAVAAAIATAVAPYLGRIGRRVVWAAALLTAVARVFVGAHLPLDVVGGLALGWLLGSIVHLVFGTRKHPPDADAVLEAIAVVTDHAVGLRRLAVDARGSSPFVASTPTGGVFAKVISSENRDADTLYKMYRFFAYRHRDDEAPYVTTTQSAEHEAYVTLLAERAGVRVPSLRGTAPIRHGTVIVSDLVDDAIVLDDQRLTERCVDILPDLWQQVARLHSVGIVHRDLRSSNVLVDRDDQAWLTDFGAARTAATPRQRAADVAQLLVSSALVTDADTATEVALDAIGADGVAAAAPLLQPLALSMATRAAVRHDQQLLESLRTTVAHRSGVEEIGLEQLARFRWTTLAILIGLGIGIHVLLPRVGELGETVESLRTANWWWVIAAFGFSGLTYLAAAVPLTAAAFIPLPYGRTVATQFAGSFANRLSVAGIGGIGVNLRYLQRHGLDRSVAAATVATTNVAGLAMHVTLLILASLAVGRSGLGDVDLPSRWMLLVVAVAILFVLGIALATPLRARVRVPLAEAIAQLRAIGRDPRRMILLFGGSIAVTGTNILALVASLAAFGAGAGFATTAFVYLAGTAVASAAPTPGGLGAVEAALVAGLTLTGVATGPAVAGVLTYRLATFWGPTLPGFVAFRVLRRRIEL